MSRFRLYPSAEQDAALLRHCSDARFVWNLGQEQRSAYRVGRGQTPGFAEQCQQLTEARRAEPWLAAGSVNVQQQALRDLDQAWRNFFAGTHRRPGFRKQGVHEGFRITEFKFARHVRRLNRRWGAVQVPKVGYVRFRWTRTVPTCKSYRVTLDRAGRWHVTFAAWPAPTVPGPGTGEVVGIDRGIMVSLALSTGEMFQAPASNDGAKRLARRLSRAKMGSNRRRAAKTRLAKVKVRDADRRKDWCEKTSTDLARRFDVIRVEDLHIANMARKPKSKPDPDRPGAFLWSGARARAGLNRGILASGWGMFAQRLTQKAPGRVEKINPRFTSQRCSACGHVAAESRKSQALFACVACAYTENADVNAAINIAAGHAVTARGGGALARPVNREPQAA